MTLSINRFVVIGLALAVALLAVPAVFAAPDFTPGPWDLTDTYVIEFTCVTGCAGTFPHTMNVTSMDLGTGEFSGDGFYNPNPAISWDVTGDVTDSALMFTIIYNNISAGYTVVASGVVAPDGTLSGTAASNASQTFTWESVSGVASRFEGNHGQYVSSRGDKKGAAQSRVGMPTQSKGHTQ